MEAELGETKGKKKSSNVRLIILVLNSYAITMFADDLPDIESFTVYRSLTSPNYLKFNKNQLPVILETFVHEEDLYYRQSLDDQQDITMYNFAELLVADLNLISQSMITFCNEHALETNRALDETRFIKKKLIMKTLMERLPCCICNQYFADYFSRKYYEGWS